MLDSAPSQAHDAQLPMGQDAVLALGELRDQLVGSTLREKPMHVMGKSRRVEVRPPSGSDLEDVGAQQLVVQRLVLLVPERPQRVYQRNDADHAEQQALHDEVAK